MLIVINVNSYYDWEDMEGQPTQEDILALRAKPSQSGKWLKKVVKTKDTHTEINLPETQIKTCVEHFERIGAPKSRNKVVAWFLEEKIAPHHAHPDNFTSIQVHGDPGLENFLNTYFNCKVESKENKSSNPVVTIETKKT